MSLEITQNSRKRSLGSLNNFRDGVEGYSIREVRLSPNGRNLVVLLNKVEPTFEGALETTLVQGFPL
jgi:predicted secreted protein